MQTSGVTLRQKVSLVLAVLLLAISISLYAGRKNTYTLAAAPSNQLTLTNPLVLQNWLPAKSLDYTVARLRDYSNAQDLEASSITVTSDVGDDHGAYAFTVTFDPEPTQYHVDVLVNNFNSAISTSVSIEGVRQNVSVPSSSQNTGFSGIDSLTTRGLTSIQGNNLQSAFIKFKPGARAVVIDTSTISASTAHSGNSFSQLMNFSVSIDSRPYTAQLDYTDVSAVRLKLFDADNNVVFDSGKVDSAS
jgi:hypothetical protein